jgi:hypothetical protein
MQRFPLWHFGIHQCKSDKRLLKEILLQLVAIWESTPKWLQGCFMKII